MRMKVFALVLGVGTALAHGSPLLYGPWTGAPGTQTVTVSWASSPAGVAWVEYGLLAQHWSVGGLPHVAVHAPTASADREIVHRHLENLSPDTWYVYRVVFPDGSSSPLGTFRTAPLTGGIASFVVIADTQWQWDSPNRVEMVAEAMGASPFTFHFVLHAGDLVETPLSSHWAFLFRSLAPTLRWAPIVPVLGNHERDSITYYQHFSLPPGGGRLGKRWWTLRWGDVVIVGLDTNARRPQDYLDQIDWLRDSLSGPEPHRFVVFHHPVFSSDAIYGPGMEGLQVLWHPVLVELGVDIVFAGHAHNYERIERDGVTYLVAGGAGATLRPLAAERVEGSQTGCDDRHFYMRVVARPNRIGVEVVAVARQLDGDVIPDEGILDRFSLPSD